MAYTDEFGNIFGTTEDFQTTPNAQDVFYNTPDTPWTGGDVFNYDWQDVLSRAPSGIDKFLSAIKGFGGKAMDFAGSDRGIMAILAALASASDRQRAGGGGTKLAYQGPRQFTRTVAPGIGGTPIARYAAEGGLMQAYAQGGHVRMEDGGFVMTKKAVDGAGGPQGIRQLVPGARPIRGPGTGTSDSIPATIQGPNGVTPAKVSNGEAYVPRAAVQQAGGPKRMYALMNSLQRKA